MSFPFDPNEDYNLDDLNPVTIGGDDFNIEDFTRQVDFDGLDLQQPQEEPVRQEPEAALSGDTGEYLPTRKEVAMRPERKHRKKQPAGVRALRTTLIVLIYLMVITFVGYLLATFGWRWVNDLLALNKEEIVASVTLDEAMFTAQEVTDEEGETSTVYTADMDQVAQVLQDNGLIEYKWLFNLFASFTHKDSKVLPGTYELNTDMDYSALLRNIGPTTATRTTVTVTIPEGYTVEETIQLLVQCGIASQEDLEEAAANYDYSYDFLSQDTLGQAERLEGYLFPDTYEFYKNSDAATALGRMLSNFDSKLTSELRTKANDMGYSLAELITIASIVEKETDGVDQTGIASVIYNRLNNTGSGTNGYLQMDSTIQYILAERKDKLTAEDLAIDSPYNTYLYKGLPAGPICCPGMDAIQAALEPDSTDYFYFILGDDGNTHFFHDYNDFLAFRDAQTGVIDTGASEEDPIEG